MLAPTLPCVPLVGRLLASRPLAGLKAFVWFSGLYCSLASPLQTETREKSKMTDDAHRLPEETAAERRGMPTAELWNAMVRIYKEQFGGAPTM